MSGKEEEEKDSYCRRKRRSGNDDERRSGGGGGKGGGEIQSNGTWQQPAAGGRGGGRGRELGYCSLASSSHLPPLVLPAFTEPKRDKPRKEKRILLPVGLFLNMD